MNVKKVAIIGGGPAGITAGYELAKSGVAVEVFEASPQVGGLAKTIDLWGQKVDIGPHRFFSNDTRINKLWLEVVGKDYKMVDRLTRIYYKKKFYYYPIKAGDALVKLGFFTSAGCFFSFVWQKIVPVKQNGTFENWVVSRFGKKLYRIFFKTYTEKLWGIKCNELDADFAAQRIKKLSLWEALKNSLTGGKGNEHKTLVDKFAYPIHGSGMVYERMKNFILSKGSKVHLNTPIRRVITKNGRATTIETEDGVLCEFDHIISSMPFTLLVSRLPETPSHILELTKTLSYRNTILVYLHVQGKDLFPDNWLYVHNADLKMGRITNFRNWVPEIVNGKDTTIVAIEYWCNDSDSDWSEIDTHWIELAKREIRLTGLIGNSTILDGHVHRIHRCYPVYGRNYKSSLKPIENYLSTIEGLSVIGRYGAFKYNNQDHSILMGLLAAENLTKGTSHNLWEINTDYEDYQEKSTITETGLEKQK